jgi:hypothetical protein
MVLSVSIAVRIQNTGLAEAKFDGARPPVEVGKREYPVMLLPFRRWTTYDLLILAGRWFLLVRKQQSTYPQRLYLR